MRINNHFYIYGCALSLALKQRLEATLNWPIPAPSMDKVTHVLIVFYLYFSQIPSACIPSLQENPQ